MLAGICRASFRHGLVEMISELSGIFGELELQSRDRSNFAAGCTSFLFIRKCDVKFRSQPETLDPKERFLDSLDPTLSDVHQNRRRKVKLWRISDSVSFNLHSADTAPVYPISFNNLVNRS
jgi:hypothetical protein